MMRNGYYLLLGLFLILSACSQISADDKIISSTDLEGGNITLSDISSVISEEELGLDDTPAYIEKEEVIDGEDDDYLENASFPTSIRINYTSSGIEIPVLPSGVSAVATGGDVIINSTIAGVEYILSGTSSDGMFKIYSEKKFKLTLNNLSLTNNDGPAINIQSSKRVFLVLPDGSSNTLADGSAYAEAINGEDQKGCLFSEAQVIISGKGSLSVTGNYKHAICIDDYIRVRSGCTIKVPSAQKDGIHANDAIILSGGSIEINSIGEGLDCEEGPISISGGTFLITTSGEKSHAIKSFGDVTISDGALKMRVKGDASKGINGDGDIFISGGKILTICTGNALYDSEENDISSPCGIKSKSDIVITGGIITSYSSGSAGKGISCDSSLTINNATIKIMTKGKAYTYKNLDSNAKGIKADGNVTINSGTILIQTMGGEGSEGLESKNNLTINGGIIEIAAYDDCINASSSIIINDGRIYCYSANNDGIDSNGTIKITGGLVVSSGTNAPEEGIDCDQNNFTITGGEILAFGGATSTPTANSCTQNSVILSASGATNSMLNLSTNAGVNIMTSCVPRTYGSFVMLYSSPSLINGSYIVSSGGNIQDATQFFFHLSGGKYTAETTLLSFTVSSRVTKIGSSAGGFGGGGGGGGFRP